MEHPLAEPRIRRAVRRGGGYCEIGWQFLLAIVFGTLGFCVFVGYQAAYAKPKAACRKAKRLWSKVTQNQSPPRLPSAAFGDDQG